MASLLRSAASRLASTGFACPRLPHSTTHAALGLDLVRSMASSVLLITYLQFSTKICFYEAERWVGS